MPLTIKRLSVSLGIVVLLANQVFADGQVETPDSPYLTVSGGWVYVPNVSEVKIEMRTTNKQGDTQTSASSHISPISSISASTAGAVGLDFGLFRLEGEVSHASAGFKGKMTHQGNSWVSGDGKLDDPKLEEIKAPLSLSAEEMRLAATRLLANVYYDVETGMGFRPYAGIGVGAVQLSLDAISYVLSGWTLAYQGLAGVGVEVVEGVDIRLGYRFVGLGLPEYSLERRYSQEVIDDKSTSTTFEVVTTAKQPIILTHQVELGVSYSY